MEVGGDLAAVAVPAGAGEHTLGEEGDEVSGVAAEVEAGMIAATGADAAATWLSEDSERWGDR